MANTLRRDDEAARQRQELGTQARFVLEMMGSDGWKTVARILERHLEALRAENEERMGEKDRDYVLGQIHTLKWIKDLPRFLTDKMKEQEVLQQYQDNQAGQALNLLGR